VQERAEKQKEVRQQKQEEKNKKGDDVLYSDAKFMPIKIKNINKNRYYW